jgi:PHP family Zn ribbon phosphoesterase
VTVFGGDLSYQGFVRALSENRLAYTVEFYPEEGKYHYDGHRKCGVCQSPEETFKQGERCRVCGRPLTLGVLHRTGILGGEAVEHTPDEDGFIRSPQGRPPYIRLIPLQEIIAEVFEQSPNTRRVQGEYWRIVQELGSELHVLISATPADLETVAGESLAQAILISRRGKVHVEPGYDGVFGKISLPNVEESHPLEEITLQPRLLGM